MAERNVKTEHEYDSNYGKILGMSNSGHSASDIANILHLSHMYVLDVLQRGHARRMMYRHNEN